ncbi:MAG: 4Fe-4S binding protein [Candidatus Brocadiaceae bacterium]|nr:4Fe-4S binding protein [Candidatus Brocadiaceae bacterium]
MKEQHAASGSAQPVYRKNNASNVDKNGGRRRKWYNSQKIRWAIQIAFFILVLVIGWQFYTFIKYCEAGGKGFYLPRPPGVESFLPISAIMGTKYFFGTGKINTIHPAGFVIFGTLLLTAIFFRRGFCSWICPVGAISEWEWRFGDWLLKKIPRKVSHVIRNIPTRFTAGLSLIFTPIIILLLLEIITMKSFKAPVFRQLMPAYIVAMILPFAVPRRFWSDKANDMIARAWKYTLLAFFLQMIVIKMPISQLELLYTRAPFIRVADVKMLKFFTNLSGIGLTVVLTFLIISIVNKNFWCRFFCPYGAILGILAYISPLRITRNLETCIHCEKCTRACPSYILVEKKKHVLTHECLACYDCVNACPVNDTLDMKSIGSRKKVLQWFYAILLIGFFAALTNTARLTGNWRTEISDAEYILRISEIDHPKYLHKEGQFEVE